MPSSLTALSILLFLLLSPACSSSSSTPFPDLSDALEEIIESIEEVRQLDLVEPLDPKYLAPEELRDFLLATLDEEFREEAQGLQELYIALGLADEGLDLYSLYVDLLTEQVVGVFDPETEDLYVLKDGRDSGTLEELTLAHELVHALQHQHYDLDALQKGVEANLDAGLALSALAEGDASLAGLFYMMSRGLTAPEVPDTPVFDAAPGIVQETLIFPYQGGIGFVARLREESGSWDGVNAAFLSPPTSTEQVIHPDRYLAGDYPLDVSLPDLIPALGEGWSLVHTDVAGEFLLRNYLEQGLSLEAVEEATTGWGGDRFATYRNQSGRRLMALLTRWDGEADALQYFDGTKVLTDGVTDWENVIDGDTAFWRGEPGRWVYTGIREDHVLAIYAHDDAVTMRVLRLFPGYR